LMLDKPEAIN